MHQDDARKQVGCKQHSAHKKTMQAELTFLGTGTSVGVPTVGCRCAVCHSTDPHDRRLRPSAMLRWPGKDREQVVIIDTGPDFREQALRHRLEHVDAVLYTHCHADHIFGMEDLRPISFTAFREKGPIPLYASDQTAAVLRRVYDYTFAPDATYPNRARVEILPLEAGAMIDGFRFTPVPVMHGEMLIHGLRVGKVAYLTDVSAIPEPSFELLHGLDHLVISALRHKPHATHATVAQATAWAQRIGASHTWFTHISHDLAHEATNRSLPPGLALAYDGLSFAVDLGEKEA